MNRAQTPPSFESMAFSIMAIGFFGVGLLFLFVIGQTITLHCEREEGVQVNCTISASWLNFYRLSEQRLVDLQSAQVDENCGDEGCSYQVLLLTQRSKVPLSSIYTSDQNEHNSFAKRVNDFLDDPDQHVMDAESGGAGITMLIPIVFMAVGVFFAFLNIRSFFR